jgi:hypothetical protein
MTTEYMPAAGRFAFAELYNNKSPTWISIIQVPSPLRIMNLRPPLMLLRLLVLLLLVVLVAGTS